MTFVPNLTDGVERLVFVPTLCSMNNMNNTNNTAEAFVTMVNEMINTRREFAEANGFTASDDEIADHIKASLIAMMKEAGR